MSSRKKNSLIDLKSFEKTKIDFLFSVADKIAANEWLSLKGQGKTGALLFFEPSTRTRMSFETACARWGIYPLRLDGVAGTSLEKGESSEDTVINVDAMKPSFLVVRGGDSIDLEKLDSEVEAPILNAGWGRLGHPTQALLDAYTIRQHLGRVEGQRVLIVGDVRHSRVAASHFELAEKLGYEVALCGPAEFIPDKAKVRVFSSLSEGLSWATVAMALRVQLERHSLQYSLTDYRDQFGFTSQNLASLSQKALILHPGPINQGTEMDSDVLRDSRCAVISQVGNGVLIRQSLLYMTIEGES